MISSQPSFNAGDRLLTLLPSIVAEVAEQVYFADAEQGEAEQFAAELEARGAWLHARVGFRGLVTGSLEILLPPDLVSELGIAALGGVSGALTDEQLNDVAGEMANMLCGALLTRANRDQRFELMPPQVVRVMDLPSGADTAVTELLFSVNDRPAIVRFRVWET